MLFSLGWLGKLRPGLATFSEILDVSGIIQFLVHIKSSSISQLINVNQEISKSYSIILIEQPLLLLIYYCQLVHYLVFMPDTQKIYLLPSYCYFFYNHLQCYFYSHHLFNNFTNFSISQNNCHYTLTDYTSAWLYQDLLSFSINVLLIFYIHDLFISSVGIISTRNTYSLFWNNICITIVTQSWTYHWSFKLYVLFGRILTTS